MPASDVIFGLWEHVIDSLDYLHQGGAIIIPLILASVWMWSLIVKKMLVIYRFRKRFGIRGLETKKFPKPIAKQFESQKTDNPEINKKLLGTIVNRMQMDLERHINTVFILASVAPLLGLLGTVTGMISTFDAISRFGTTNARAFAAGISEALITTQLGLVVAVPGLFMGHFLRRRTDKLIGWLDRILIRYTLTLEAADVTIGGEES